VQCPYCSGWFTIGKGRPPELVIVGHCLTTRDKRCRKLKENPFPPLRETRYTSIMFRGHHEGMGTNRCFQTLLQRVPFAPGYSPPEPSSTADPTSIQHNMDSLSTILTERPEYLDNFGWVEYKESLGASASALIQLNTLPSNCCADLWPEGSSGRKIEDGLIIVSMFVALYLEDANRKVNKSHPTIRQAITIGYGKCQPTDGNSRSLTPFFFVFFQM
jgi:hypothetical protein